MSRVYFGSLTMEAGAAAVTLLAALTRELRVLNALRKELLSATPREEGGAGTAQSKARPRLGQLPEGPSESSVLPCQRAEGPHHNLW